MEFQIITELFEKGPVSVAQHCDPPYRAIGYSYTYRSYVFQGIAVYRAIPPTIMLMFWKHVGGGGYRRSRLLSPLEGAIGRYRGVSQLYCRKSRFNGPLRALSCNSILSRSWTGVNLVILGASVASGCQCLLPGYSRQIFPNRPLPVKKWRYIFRK